MDGGNYLIFTPRNVVSMMKERTMIWIEHVPRMGLLNDAVNSSHHIAPCMEEIRNANRILDGTLEGRRPFERGVAIG